MSSTPKAAPSANIVPRCKKFDIARLEQVRCHANLRLSLNRTHRTQRLSNPGGFDDCCHFNAPGTPPLVRIDDH